MLQTTLRQQHKKCHFPSAKHNLLHQPSAYTLPALALICLINASHQPFTYLGAYSFRMPSATHIRYISPSYRYTSQICAATSNGSVYCKDKV
jgi:hypothetical protein